MFTRVQYPIFDGGKAMWDGAMVKHPPGHRPWMISESLWVFCHLRQPAPNEPSWIHRRHRKKVPTFLIKIILKSIKKNNFPKKSFLVLTWRSSELFLRFLVERWVRVSPVRSLRSASTRYRSSASGSLLRSRQPGRSRTSWSTELSWSIRDTAGPWLWLSYTIPSGKLTVCYWKLQFIVDLPMKHGDFP